MISAGFCSHTPVYIQTRYLLANCAIRPTNGAPTARLSATSVASKSIAATAAAAFLVFSYLSPASGVVSAPPCIAGEGPGCEASRAESPLIRELLEKSRANREKNEKETLERYWQQGYGDYFSYGYNKELKRGEDGKWSLEDPEDVFTAGKRLIDELTKNKDK